MRKAVMFILVLAVAAIVPACSLLNSGSQELPTRLPPESRGLIFSPVELPTALVGKPYEVRIDIGNVETFAGLFEIQEGSLPAGLALERVKSENAVIITGVPAVEGQFPFVLFVQCMGTNDPGQEGRMKYAIVVEPAP